MSDQVLSEDNLERLRRAIPHAGNDPHAEEIHAEGYRLAVAMLEAAADLGYDIGTRLLATVSQAAYQAASVRVARRTRDE